MECLERVYNVSLKNSSDKSKFHVEKSLIKIFESTTDFKVYKSLVVRDAQNTYGYTTHDFLSVLVLCLLLCLMYTVLSL